MAAARSAPIWCRSLRKLVLSTNFLRMDKTISASEANQRFSEMLRRVAEGDSFTVMSRGRAVARVTPVGDTKGDRKAMEELLAFAQTLPRRTVAPWKREDLYD